MRIVKRDGRHEELDRKKLTGGIHRACEKRPISEQQIEAVVDSIIAELEGEYEREVPSTVIGQKVMNKLQEPSSEDPANGLTRIFTDSTKLKSDTTAKAKTPVKIIPKVVRDFEKKTSGKKKAVRDGRTGGG